MKAKIVLVGLLILSFLPLVSLLKPGLPITHDGKDHVARIANFYQNLSDGTVIPRWGGNLNWGYGHPVLMFLYPLPSYIASLFHFIGFSFVDSTKLVFGVAYILSGLAMFLWLRKITSLPAAFLGSMLYLFAPYRFVDLYVRGAIGEHVAFIFPPLIAYLMVRIKDEDKRWLVPVTSLALAGFILAHNAISIMFIPLLFLYGVLLVWSAKEKRGPALRYLSVLVFGFLLSAFFWIPAFFEGKYTLRDIVTVTDFRKRLYPLSQFIYSPWGYGVSGFFSLQVGIFHLLSLIAGAVVSVYFFMKKRNRRALLFFLPAFISCLVLFLMVPPSFFLWDSISLLQKFQFPWRFLSVIVFTTSFLGALLLTLLPRKFQIVCIVFVLMGLFLQLNQWQIKGSLQYPEAYYTGVYDSTTDTGESSPIWSMRFMEKRFDKPIELIGGQAVITNGVRIQTSHQYHIESENTAQFVENTVYFPGWQVFVDGAPRDIVYQDMNHRGLITFTVPTGTHEVVVKFSETRLRLVADMVSLIALVLLPAFYLLLRQKTFARLYHYKKP